MWQPHAGLVLSAVYERVRQPLWILELAEERGITIVMMCEGDPKREIIIVGKAKSLPS